MTDTVVERSPLTAAILEEHAAKWIAVRDGDVVAEAETLEDLRANQDVRREDAVYLVPERASYFF
jgi:hypothetical protein